MPRSLLVELYAHGLGIIEDARLEFGPGFNVLTGETGAGKTLLLGALDLCLGGDGAVSRPTLRSDMRAAAVFARDLEGEVVLTRESGSTGRLRSSVNGVPSSAEALRALAEQLVVIHGQHDSLKLRHRAEVVRIIDAHGSVSTVELDRVRRSLREARQLLESLGGDSERRARELEFVSFQILELESAAIRSSRELDETLEELTRLTELRDGQASLFDVLERLDADNDDAVLTLLAQAIAHLPPGDAYDAVRAMLKSALDLAREGVHELAALSDPDAFDSEALKALEDRASLLQGVARKYGGSLELALTVLDRLTEESRLHVEATSRLATLDREVAELASRAADLARETLHQRESAAERLSQAVRSQLPRVALPHAMLRFQVGGDDGSDAQILFTANPGTAEGPLQDLASGGELSRVLLALSLESVNEDVVAVFDEVDAGIGGQVAQQIGDCLCEVGRDQQVLAVTHLASVAAKADHHFVVEKELVGGVSATRVRSVTGDDRVTEIARMLAGDEITPESRALARRLLETRS